MVSARAERMQCAEPEDVAEAVGGLCSPRALNGTGHMLVADAVGTLAESMHRITHSVFVECHAMYRRAGPHEQRSLGETEFASGAAATGNSGLWWSDSDIRYRVRPAPSPASSTARTTGSTAGRGDR